MRFSNYITKGLVRLILIVSGLAICTPGNSQVFNSPESIAIGSPYLYDSQYRNVEWADFDSNGQMDLLVNKFIYLKEGDSLQLSQLKDSVGYYYKAVDLNNDNHVDIIEIENSCLSIYRNDGTGYFSISDSLKFPMAEGGLDVADLDNDGDQDIALIGTDGGYGVYLKILVNNDGFGDDIVELPGVCRGDVKCFDHDNDGLFDIIISGSDFNGNRSTRLFHNNGDLNFNVQDLPGLIGMERSQILIADINDDSKSDLICTGNMNGYFQGFFLNHGDYFNSYQIDKTNYLTEIVQGDYNNNGSVDLMALTGGATELVLFPDLDTNSSGPISLYNLPFENKSLSQCDYDNDNDLDLFYTNFFMIPEETDTSFFHKREYVFFLENLEADINTKPQPPVNLQVEVIGGVSYLSWQRGNDNETHEKTLTYNLVIGSIPGACDIVSPNSDLISGKRKIVGPGNCHGDTLCIINNLPPGTYYWSVQSIDNAFVGSQFSEELVFDVKPDFEFKEYVIGGEYSPEYFQVADFDNDNDLDLLMRLVTDGSSKIAMYENIDGKFSRSDFEYQGLHAGELVCFDMNNDNLIDFFEMGTDKDFTDEHSRVFINNGVMSFEKLETSTAGFYYGNAGVGDYNNDGYTDLVISGSSDIRKSGGVLYLNSKHMDFESHSYPYGGIDMGASDFFDYDNDYDNDLFMSTANGALIFLNEGDLISMDNAISLGSFVSLKSDFGDFDNDNDVDLLLTGLDAEWNNFVWIFRNQSGEFKKYPQDFRASYNQKSLWIDSNNDSKSDFIVLGQNQAQLTIYLNSGANFTPKTIELPDQQHNSYAIGDFDKDGDFDIITGTEYIFYVSTNNGNWPNEAPTAPANLTSRVEGSDGIRLGWDFAYDAQSNEGGLSYNLRIGSTPGGVDIMSPLSDPISGYRRIPKMGNAQLNNGWWIKDLPEGKYYWSVQAIDQSFVGGAWAKEDTFVVGVLEMDFEVEGSCTVDKMFFRDLSSGPVSNWHWDFGDGGSSTYQNPNYSYSQPGKYQVILSSEYGGNIYTKTQVIEIGNTPLVDFSFESVELGGFTPFINQTDTAGIEIVYWKWDFGDGGKYVGQYPVNHFYQESGIFNVSLTAYSSGGCRDSISKEVSTCINLPDTPDIIVRGPNVWYLACSNNSVNFYQWFYNGSPIPDANEFVFVANDQLGDYYVEVSDDEQCYARSETITLPVVVTGFEENPFAGLKIYPNPTPGIFNIEMDNPIFGDLLIDIFTEQGSKVIAIEFLKETSHFEAQVDLSGQPVGLYLIGLRLSEFKTSRKIVIE